MGGGGNLPIGPGIWGFIAFFVLAVALWLLVRNMNARLRRMAYSDRDRAESAAREAEADRLGRAEPTPEPTSGPTAGRTEGATSDSDGTSPGDPEGPEPSDGRPGGR